MTHLTNPLRRFRGLLFRDAPQSLQRSGRRFLVLFAVVCGKPPKVGEAGVEGGFGHRGRDWTGLSLQHPACTRQPHVSQYVCGALADVRLKGIMQLPCTDTDGGGHIINPDVCPQVLLQVIAG